MFENEGTMKHLRTVVKNRVNLVMGKFLNIFFQSNIGPVLMASHYVTCVSRGAKLGRYEAK